MVGAYASLKELETRPDRCRQLFKMSAVEGAEWAAPMLAILDLRISEAEYLSSRAAVAPFQDRERVLLIGPVVQSEHDDGAHIGPQSQR